MFHCGDNFVDGIPVKVVRKRLRRINLRIDREGSVCVSLPLWGVTLGEAWDFMMSKWRWVLKSRREMLALHAHEPAAPTSSEVEALRDLLVELNRKWFSTLGEKPFAIRLRRMKSVWGSCRWQERKIVYNTELCRFPREIVEYVVVHELTHFAVPNHGQDFRALMDARLPGWRELRKRLNASSRGTVEPAEVGDRFR